MWSVVCFTMLTEVVVSLTEDGGWPREQTRKNLEVAIGAIGKAIPQKRWWLGCRLRYSDRLVVRLWDSERKRRSRHYGRWAGG
jgi:hypothetical protein